MTFDRTAHSFFFHWLEYDGGVRSVALHFLSTKWPVYCVVKLQVTEGSVLVLLIFAADQLSVYSQLSFSWDLMML